MNGRSEGGTKCRIKEGEEGEEVRLDRVCNGSAMVGSFGSLVRWRRLIHLLLLSLEVLVGQCVMDGMERRASSWVVAVLSSDVMSRCPVVNCPSSPSSNLARLANLAI